MTKKEQTALQNDLQRLKKTFNPQYVTFSHLPNHGKTIFRFKMHMHNITTYIKKKNTSSPVAVHEIDVFFDILPGYPETKPIVYYGEDKWLCHVNTFSSNSHNQCTDVYDPKNSSLVELAIKTARAVVYDKNVVRYNSMATSSLKDWQQKMEKNGTFPTMESSKLFLETVKRKPGAKRTPRSA